MRGVGLHRQRAGGLDAGVLDEGLDLGGRGAQVLLAPQREVGKVLRRQVDTDFFPVCGGEVLVGQVDAGGRSALVFVEAADVAIGIADTGLEIRIDMDHGAGRDGLKARVGGERRRGLRAAVSEIFVDIAGTCAAGQLDRVALGQSLALPQAAGGFEIAGHLGLILTDKVARHGDADGHTDAGGGTHPRRERHRADEGVDGGRAVCRDGDGASLLSGHAERAVLDVGVGARQDDVGRLRAAPAHRNAGGAAADRDRHCGSDCGGLDGCVTERVNRHVARRREVSDTVDVGRNVVVDPVVRQCQADGD